MSGRNLDIVVQMAVFVEMILEERSGVKSAIRIYDRITLEPRDMETLDGGNAMFPVTLVLMLTSPHQTVEGDLRMDLELPTGDVTPGDVKAIAGSTPPGTGYSITTITGQLGIGPLMNGLYWVHVFFDDRELTRLPLTIVLPASGEPGEA